VRGLELVERRRLKYAATINEEALAEDTDPEYELRYVDIGDVDSSGNVNESVRYLFADAPTRARRLVRDGDVIISTVRTYLQAIAPIEEPPANLVVSTGFAVVRPRPEILDAGFCKYALREPRFLAEVVMRSVGVGYPVINPSELGDIRIYLPLRQLQGAIANHLDRETARLDRLVAVKELVLQLVGDKRRSLISRAVTRGLDPSAVLRYSGIPWLGEVPAHWDVEQAKWLFRERDERSETGSEELLTVSHLTGVTPRAEKDVNMFEAETTEGYKICRTGDLVINTLWAWMGAMGISPVAGIVSPAYNVYSPTGRLEPSFVDALVRIPIFAQEVARHSKGVWSSRLRLYPESFFEIGLPVPPFGEQRAIVNHIACKTAKLDALRAATERTITLLKERRAALIADAVAGRLQIAEPA